MPNIVLILADDMGYGDASRLNPDANFQTRDRDSLAENGMVFTGAHGNSAVCTPHPLWLAHGTDCNLTWMTGNARSLCRQCTSGRSLPFMRFQVIDPMPIRMPGTIIEWNDQLSNCRFR